MPFQSRKDQFFTLPDRAMIYNLDGNSLGPLPRAASGPGGPDAWWTNGATCLITRLEQGLGWTGAAMALGDRLGAIESGQNRHVTLGYALSIKGFRRCPPHSAMDGPQGNSCRTAAPFASDLYIGRRVDPRL